MIVVLRLALVLLAGASTPLAAQTTRPAAGQIDACGTLVRGAECVLFEGGGGRYYLADTGRFQVGDRVRVIGRVDPDCITICGEGDGCIRGAILYDPDIFPCGSRIPDLRRDLCSGASAALSGAALAGAWVLRRRAGR